MIQEGLREELAELRAEAQKANKSEGWFMLGGMGWLFFRHYMAPSETPLWLACAGLFLLFRMIHQAQHIIINQARNEAVNRAILAKLEAIKPEPKYD